MSDKFSKSDSCLANQAGSLTIFDAPNVCRDIMAQCETLAKHPDSTVAKAAEGIGKNAKQMLDLILSATDQLLEKVA